MGNKSKERLIPPRNVIDLPTSDEYYSGMTIGRFVNVAQTSYKGSRGTKSEPRFMMEHDRLLMHQQKLQSLMNQVKGPDKEQAKEILQDIITSKLDNERPALPPIKIPAASSLNI